MANACLVVGPAWVGDMVMAQSLFMTLREKNVETAVDVVAPPWSLPLLARMPEIRDAIEMPVGHGRFAWRERRRIGITLRNRAYERAIVLPRSFKSALVPFHARIRTRTGYRGEMRFGLLNDIRRMDKTLLTRTVQRVHSSVPINRPVAGQPLVIPVSSEVDHPVLPMRAPRRVFIVSVVGLELCREGRRGRLGADSEECWTLSCGSCVDVENK